MLSGLPFISIAAMAQFTHTHAGAKVVDAIGIVECGANTRSNANINARKVGRSANQSVASLATFYIAN